MVIGVSLSSDADHLLTYLCFLTTGFRRMISTRTLPGEEEDAFARVAGCRIGLGSRRGSRPGRTAVRCRRGV